MGWTNREAGFRHYSGTPGYKGNAYGANAAPSPNWQKGWSPTSEMARPFSRAVQTYGGDKGKGGQGNVYRASPQHHPAYTTSGGSGVGINTIMQDPADNFKMHTDQYIEPEDEKRKWEDDHNVLAHMKIPSLEMLKKVGDVAQDAFRGSRLMNAYEDRAVTEGRSKAAGFKDWTNAKKSMMTARDEAFYNKYMDIYARTGDPADKATAETAWRNKQTSDRLAAGQGFEDYMPSKYSGVGEGSRYTGGYRMVDGEMKEAGDLVPGRGRMDEIAKLRGWGNWYPGEGSPRSLAEGQDAIASQMPMPTLEGYEGNEYDLENQTLGYEGNEYDLENQIKMLEDQTLAGYNEDDFTLGPDFSYLPHHTKRSMPQYNLDPTITEDEERALTPLEKKLFRR